MSRIKAGWGLQTAIGPPTEPNDYDEKTMREAQMVTLEEPVKADTNDRRTPRWFFEQCRARFGPFDLDVAAVAENAHCGLWLGPGSPFGEDALSRQWCSPEGRALTCWANPPYGPGGTIEKWIEKARVQRNEYGTRTLMLLPADTSTRWYHDVSRTELCELVPFRLSFDAPDGSTKGNSAKFGSLLVWIAPKISRRATGAI
jgi:phage N-6-adenine-methyltransferase